jgi:hypothetical protein
MQIYLELEYKPLVAQSKSALFEAREAGGSNPLRGFFILFILNYFFLMLVYKLGWTLSQIIIC